MLRPALGLETTFPAGCAIALGAEIVALVTLKTLLHRVVNTFLEVAALQDSFEYQLAEVTLHFGVAAQGCGEVVGLLGDGAVEFHQLFELLSERATLGILRGVDFLYSLAELCDIILEGFEQYIHRLLVGLLESFGVLLHHLARQTLELGTERGL